MLYVALLLILILLSSGRFRLLVIFGTVRFHIFEVFIILAIKSGPRRHCRNLGLLSLGLVGIRNEIDVLVCLGEVEQVKVALNLVSLILLNHALQADQSDVLVGFQLPLLLLLLTSLGHSVMLAVLHRGIDHLVVELIRVALSGLLTELLYWK